MSELEEIEGGCLCGDIRYRATGPWLRFLHCHCSRCRHATGSGHASNLFTAPDNLQWLTDEANIIRYDLPSAESFAVCFCSTCGSPLPHLTRNGSAWTIPAGSLDGEPFARPTARIFWSSRAPWSCSGGELPCFDAYPKE